MKTSHVRSIGFIIALTGFTLIAWGITAQFKNRILLNRGVVVEALHTDLRATKRAGRSNPTVRRVILAFQAENREVETSIPTPNSKYWDPFDESPTLLVYDPKKPERVQFKSIVDEQPISWGPYGFGFLMTIVGIFTFLSTRKETMNT